MNNNIGDQVLVKIFYLYCRFIPHKGTKEIKWHPQSTASYKQTVLGALLVTRVRGAGIVFKERHDFVGAFWGIGFTG